MTRIIIWIITLTMILSPERGFSQEHTSVYMCNIDFNSTYLKAYKSYLKLPIDERIDRVSILFEEGIKDTSQICFDFMINDLIGLLGIGVNGHCYGFFCFKGFYSADCLTPYRDSLLIRLALKQHLVKSEPSSKSTFIGRMKRIDIDDLGSTDLMVFYLNCSAAERILFVEYYATKLPVSIVDLMQDDLDAVLNASTIKITESQKINTENLKKAIYTWLASI